MRFVPLSVVKNETYIIEAFGWHTRSWVGHRLVFDRDHTDDPHRLSALLRRSQVTGAP